jgi:hypothetical protein
LENGFVIIAIFLTGRNLHIDVQIPMIGVILAIVVSARNPMMVLLNVVIVVFDFSEVSLARKDMLTKTLFVVFSNVLIVGVF